MEKKQDSVEEHKEEEEEKRVESIEEKKKRYEGLPMEDSPYLRYKDVEEYKLQAYGTKGHLQPVAGRGGGSTDAPTVAGSDKPFSEEAQLSSTDAINRQGVP